MSTSLTESTSVKHIGGNSYSAYFHEDWCVGTVPHGGYVTSTFLSVAKCHFTTIRTSFNQPHTIATQLNFLRRSALGPATFTVTELKLGSRTSTLYIVLTQGDSPLPLVVGFFTQSNFDHEDGLSLPSRINSLALHPLRPPLLQSSTAALRDGTDPNWTLFQNPYGKFRKAGQHLAMYVSRQTYTPQHTTTTTTTTTTSSTSTSTAPVRLIDLWLTMPGQRFTQESLGYVVDSFPQMVEMAKTSQEAPQSSAAAAPSSSSTSSSAPTKGVAGGGTGGETRRNIDKALWAKFWYPTVTLNMEMKKLLPSHGVEWLSSRVTCSQIRNGRMDIEIVVFDEAGELVALSNHVALIVPAQRNMQRGDQNGGGGGNGKGKSSRANRNAGDGDGQGGSKL